MNQVRADRLADLDEFRRRAFYLTTPLGDNIKDSFDLMSVLVRDGIANERNLSYQIQSFLNSNQQAQSNDVQSNQPLHRLVYGLTSAFATTIQSILDDRGGPAPHMHQQQLGLFAQPQQQDEEQAESPFDTTESADSDQSLFLPFGLIKQEPVDNESDPVMPNFPNNAQLAASRLQLHSNEPLSSFDTQARFLSGDLSPINTPHQRQLMRFGGEGEADSDGDESWMRPTPRNDVAALPVSGAPGLYTVRVTAVPHMSAAAKKFKKVSCTICHMKFSSESRLKCHTTMVHKDVKTAAKRAQSEAPAVAGRKGAARAAPAAASPESFKCLQCDEAFTTLAGMRRHMTRSHTGNSPAAKTSIKKAQSSSPISKKKSSDGKGSFACDQCDKVYDTSKAYKTHRWQRHPEAKARASVAPKVKSPEKRGSLPKVGKGKGLTAAHAQAGFVCCTICNNRLQNISALNCHMRNEHDAKPYQCTECDETFGRKTEVANHRKSVHGGK